MENNIQKVTLESLDLWVQKLDLMVKQNQSDIRSLKASDAQKGRDIREIQEDYPLDPCMADDIAKAVMRKGVAVMGGKNSGAYKNTGIRSKVYRDIYTEVKRQYGLIKENGYQESYKKLKKKHFKGALNIIDNYVLPLSLENEITSANEVDELND